jgi:hypothetical protein
MSGVEREPARVCNNIGSGRRKHTSFRSDKLILRLKNYP